MVNESHQSQLLESRKFQSLQDISNRGELIGVQQKKWFGEKPFGMVLVEGGAYIMGKSDEDLAQLQNAPAKTVTVPSF